jgi:hypothetical protein
MKKTFLPLIATLAILLSACNMTVLTGSGKIIRSNRPVSGFTRLVFDAPGEMTITQAEKESLSIEGDDNLQANIKSEVKDGELHIYVVPQGSQIISSQTIRYTLSIKTLEKLSVNGIGSVNAAELKDLQTLKLNGAGSMMLGKVSASTLDMVINGAGSLNLEKLTATKVSLDMNGLGSLNNKTVNADELQATVNGAGSCVLAGKVTRQHLSLTGSGSYSARELESKQIETK